MENNNATSHEHDHEITPGAAQEAAAASLMYRLIMEYPKEKEYLQLPGDFRKIPQGMRELLDGTDIEDLTLIRRASHGMWPDFVVTDVKEISDEYTPPQGDQPGIHESKAMIYISKTPTKEECQRAWSSRLEYERSWGTVPTETLFTLVKSRLFTITNLGKKITPALYASNADIELYLYPIREELEKVLRGKNDPTERRLSEREKSYLLINETVRKFNPYIHALKKEPEFINRPIEELTNVILDYFKEKTGCSNDLIQDGRIMDILNPAILRDNFRFFFPRTKRDLSDFIEYARKRFGSKQYYKLPQGTVINKIIHSMGAVEDVITQLDLFGTATIPIDKDFTLVITNYKKPLSQAARKLLDIFLMEYPKQGLSIELSLKEYMEDYTGYTDKDYAKEQLQKILNGKELANIGFEVREKGKPSGHIYLNGGTSTYLKGKARWNFNTDFQPILEKSFMAEMPKGYLRTNDKWHPNAYYLSRAIWIDWRMNEGNDTPFPIKSLIEKCPPLKKKLPTKKKFEDIQERFIDDLESLDDIFVDYIDPTGMIVEDPKSLSWDEFYNSSVRVDHSDFPHHPQRLEAKHRKKKQLENAIAKERAKKILKKNQ